MLHLKEKLIMRKTAALLIAIFMLLSLVSCTKTITAPTQAPDATTNSAENTSEAGVTTSANAEVTTEQTTDSAAVTPLQQTAYEILCSAVNKTNSLASFSADIKCNIAINYFGLKQTMTSETTVTASHADTRSPVYIANSVYTDSDGTTNTDVYFENGCYYVTDYGINAKIPQSEEADIYYDCLSEIKEMTIAFSENALSSATVETGKDSSKTISATLSADLPELCEIAANQGTFFENSELGTLNLNGAELLCTIDKNGYVLSYKITFDFTWKLEYEGFTQTIDMIEEWSVAYLSPGTGVFVIPPEGYASYPLTEAENILYRVLETAVENTSSLDDISAECSTNVSMEMLGMTVDTYVYDKIRAKDLHTTSAVYHSVIASLAESRPYSEIYYENGYYSVTRIGEKFKFNENIAKEDYASLDAVFDTVKTLSKDTMRNANIVMEKNGDIHISVLIEEDYFSEAFKDIITNIDSDSVDADNIKSRKLYVPFADIYIDKNGFIVSYEIFYVEEMTIVTGGEEHPVYMEVSVSVEFNAPGGNVTVVAPEGYAEFEEIYNDILS